MRIYFIGCLLLLSGNLWGQKIVKKRVLADGIDLIQVNTANCFEVHINTFEGNEVEVEAAIEGEYSQDLDVEVRRNGATIFVEASFVPNFENPNDKLSAHKIVSIMLYITVPSSRTVEVYGTTSRVMAKGNYKGLGVTLSDGACELYKVEGKVNVKTQSGTIAVKAQAAEIETQSRYGSVTLNTIPNGTSKYNLQTVTGNIELSKTE